MTPINQHPDSDGVCSHSGARLDAPATNTCNHTSRRALCDECLNQALKQAIEERDELRGDYNNACELVAMMHRAGLGETTGPRRGVIEDIEDLRTERDSARDKLAVASEALEYYSDKNEWIDYRATGVAAGRIIQVDSHFDGDLGQHARDALERIKG